MYMYTGVLLVHSVIDGDYYHNQVPFYRGLDNLNTQPTICSMSCTTTYNQLLAPEGFVVFITEAQDTIEVM